MELIGHIGVDAGLCWIGDPCYLCEGRGPMQNWENFCDQLDFSNDFQQFKYDAGHDGLGLVVSTGYGDGYYPVYIERDERGRVKSAKVVFIHDEDEDVEKS